MALRAGEVSWHWLETNADEPEIQGLIRQEIIKGTIRVVPAGVGGIRIVPTRDPGLAATGAETRRAGFSGASAR